MHVNILPAIRDENINRKVVKMAQQVEALAAKPEVDPWDIHGGKNTLNITNFL